MKTLQDKIAFYKQNKNILNSEIRDNYEEHFRIDYSHNSTAIEGNTLSSLDVSLLLTDKISVGGKKLREIFEVVNHDKAFSYIKKCTENNILLDENIVKNIHATVMDNILTGGVYRSVDVYISGARHTPPPPIKAYEDMKYFFYTLQNYSEDAITLSAYTHAEFVKIHPFVDGNGRTARLLMNYQLMANGLPPISINSKDRYTYYSALDEYACTGNLEPFIQQITQLEHEQLDKYNGAITVMLKAQKDRIAPSIDEDELER